MYPVYSALVRQHELGSLCAALESPINRSEAAVLRGIDQWFDAADEKIEAWQLRQLLQTTRLATEDNLQALVQRHLRQGRKTSPSARLRERSITSLCSITRTVLPKQSTSGRLNRNMLRRSSSLPSGRLQRRYRVSLPNSRPCLVS
jgi:hypothetical protein